jgi:hypothetical protein
METFANIHAPPRETDATTTPATMSARPNVFSESSVADAFVTKFQHRIIGFDHDLDDEDPDDNPSFLVVHDCKPTAVSVEIISHGGFVPAGFVITKIRELVEALTRDCDELTRVRCGAFSFAKGVFEYLKTDPRLVAKKMHPSSRAYDYARLSSIMESPRARIATG